MIRYAAAGQPAPHLFSAIIACAIPIVILGGGALAANYLERKTIHQTAPKDFFIKNQGLAFQRAAAHTPDVLLFYGSSELIDPIPNRASDFFSSEPSGFQVCPVGKAGTTSLIILQKVGALGGDLRGRKIAISLSPSSFSTPAVSPHAYAANFSLGAASGLLFGSALNSNLKADIAKRMLNFPDTLRKSALLELAAKCIASNHPRDRIVLAVLWPLGRLQNAVFDLQDHFEALVYILGNRNNMLLPEARSAHPRKTPSNNAAAAASTESFSPAGSGPDAAFRERIATAKEWTDLELLFRTLTDLNAHPFILSMPVDTAYHWGRGVSRNARQLYYDKLRELAGQYRFPVIDFDDHDTDSDFLIARKEHPSPQGWMYYNRALNDFFHAPK
ncbi:MAG TPA: D-alanyl-lipoteichoic acid biosynthesis protein DltD [Chthoniobacterales bacterium]|nr:D-alanyl-lipoteichoic acid biosynthesis protein DltD [Chthoniobacterales bacterium]